MCSLRFDLEHRGWRWGVQLHEVPFVPVEVHEHGNCAEGAFARFSEEFHAAGFHGCVVAVKIISMEIQKDAVAGLVADTRFLDRRGGHGEEQLGFLAAGRRDQNPPSPAVHGSVFDDAKPETIFIKIEGRVVIAYDNSDISDRLLHEGRASITVCIASASIPVRVSERRRLMLKPRVFSVPLARGAVWGSFMVEGAWG